MNAMVASSTAAAELARFCADLRWERLGEDVKARARELLLDLIGVALGGSRQASSRAATEAALVLGGTSGQASVFGRAERTGAVWAALANGAAAHALELDDVTTESSLHPGVAVTPAALALAQELAAPPTRLLEAIVVRLRGDDARRQRAQSGVGIRTWVPSNGCRRSVWRHDGGLSPAAAGR